MRPSAGARGGVEAARADPGAVGAPAARARADLGAAQAAPRSARARRRAAPGEPTGCDALGGAEDRRGDLRPGPRHVAAQPAVGLLLQLDPGDLPPQAHAVSAPRI